MVEKRIVITGGNGYIGSRLAYFLAKKGFEVIPVCNSLIPDDDEWRSAMQMIIQGDIRSTKAFEHISAVKPDTIIHLISLDHNQSGKNIKETIEINVKATWELLEVAKKCGVKKFIYFSTIHLYGNDNQDVITEKTLPSPISSYALTHYMSENIVNYYGLTTNIITFNVRLSNSYGEPKIPIMNCWDLVVNDLCRSAYFTKQIVLKSDGLSTRDFIHYSAICNYIESLLYVDSKIYGNTFNLCSGKSIRLVDLALKIKEVYRIRYKETINVFVKSNQLVSSVIKNNNSSNIISNNKINEVSPNYEFSIELGINLIFEYLENNKNIFKNAIS